MFFSETQSFLRVYLSFGGWYVHLKQKMMSILDLDRHSTLTVLASASDFAGSYALAARLKQFIVCVNIFDPLKRLTPQACLESEVKLVDHVPDEPHTMLAWIPDLRSQYCSLMRDHSIILVWPQGVSLNSVISSDVGSDVSRVLSAPNVVSVWASKGSALPPFVCSKPVYVIPEGALLSPIAVPDLSTERPIDTKFDLVVFEDLVDGLQDHLATTLNGCGLILKALTQTKRVEDLNKILVLTHRDRLADGFRDFALSMGLPVEFVGVKDLETAVNYFKKRPVHSVMICLEASLPLSALLCVVASGLPIVHCTQWDMGLRTDASDISFVSKALLPCGLYKSQKEAFKASQICNASVFRDFYVRAAPPSLMKRPPPRGTPSLSSTKKECGDSIPRTDEAAVKVSFKEGFLRHVPERVSLVVD